MWLRRIEIHGLRNISQAELYPSDGYNLIFGDNGSGKSSIVEAIHCLSTGHSFRTNKKLPIIQQGKNEVTVFGELVKGETIYRLGLQKKRDGSTQVKLDGRNIESQTEMALLLPAIGLTPESEDLLSGSAKVRRAYLDWSLFHVEQPFRELWKNYRRVLTQRNLALKAGYEVSAIRSWDTSLVNLGSEVDRLRKLTLSRLIDIISIEIRQLIPDVALSFFFRQGWPKELSLSESLTQSIEIDKKMGFTHTGPHRADIVLKTDHGSLAHTLSRGQRKLLMLALKIAQAQDYYQQTGNRPILFIDDLPAELDFQNRQKVLHRLIEIQSQLFISVTAISDFSNTELKAGQVFHVEQGRVSNNGIMSADLTYGASL